jgi:hypothetical protein
MASFATIRLHSFHQRVKIVLTPVAVPFTLRCRKSRVADLSRSELRQHAAALLLFDIWTEREERVTLCLWRAYVLVLIKIKLCYTD